MIGLAKIAALFLGAAEQSARRETILDNANAAADRARSGRERAEKTAQFSTVEAFEGIAQSMRGDDKGKR